MNKEKILNVIVFYDNYDEVVTYLEEIKKNNDELVDIILVINKDSKGVSTAIADLYENVRILDYNENLGYLNAFLYGISIVDLNDYKYYILSNTDISYISIDFFECLLKNEYDKNIGCIAPSVYNVNSNSYSNPHYLVRISERKIDRLIFVFSNLILTNLYMWLAAKKSRSTKVIEKESCYVYSPHGCYMIFTREFIQYIKDYRYGVKLYSEESAIGELLMRNNKKCYYDNTLKVAHIGCAVTGKINSKERISYWRESLKYIKKEFY